MIEAPKGGLTLDYGPTQAAPIEGREPTTDDTRVASTRRRDVTNLVSGMSQQLPTEPVDANFSVPSDLFVEGQDSGLGTEDPLLTAFFLSTCFRSP